jgi:hypothetical protein
MPAAKEQPAPRNARLEAVIRALIAHCRYNRWAGYDPYDALNSRVFAALPFLNSWLPRLVLTQGLKRSPLNLRRLLLVPKTENPKAIALFLSAFLKLSKMGFAEAHSTADLMIEKLVRLQSQGLSYWCWGYSFPWQTRTIVVPTGTPNLVCTTFVANALMDAYEQRHDTRCLQMAVSTAEYILNELLWTSGGAVAAFSYPLPGLRNQVYNANFLGAALLCRAYRLTGNAKFLAPAVRVARCAAARQEADGSWYYGEAPSQRWIDNFHTGYNLCALRSIGRDAETPAFESHLRRGFDFYRASFFRADGAPKYFHDRAYPIDIHCVAQSIITLLALKDLDPGNVSLAHTVCEWAVKHMWDEQGFFKYRVHRVYTNGISYMRWSQAWMLLALSELLSESHAATETREKDAARVLAEAC